MSEPATKYDLEQATTQLRGEIGAMGEGLRGEMREMKEELRGEMREMKEELRGEMGAMEARLVRQIEESGSRVANVMMEHISALVAPFDEKYKDLLPAHAQLRADFDTHVADARLHMRQPAAPARRARRPRSR